MIKIIIVFFIIIAIFMYLIILGANKNNKDEDLEFKIREDYEKWKNEKGEK